MFTIRSTFHPADVESGVFDSGITLNLTFLTLLCFIAAIFLRRAEQLDYETVLDMTLYLEKETEYIPWDAAYSNLLWLGEMLRYQPAYSDWRVS